MCFQVLLCKKWSCKNIHGSNEYVQHFRRMVLHGASISTPLLSMCARARARSHPKREQKKLENIRGLKFKILEVGSCFALRNV